MLDQLELFLIFLKSSALAVSGLASLPLLRADLVPRFVTDAAIVQSLAIGRLGPGPNGIYIVSLGYLVAGWPGALYSLIAASVAPLAILPATALARRWLLSSWFGGLIRGVSLGTAGLLLATSVTIIEAGGTAIWQLALAVIAVALTIHGKLHPALMIGIGTAGGLLLGR
jgi:chromate transporter